MRAIATGLITCGPLGLTILRLVRRLRSGRVEATLVLAARRSVMTGLEALLRAAGPVAGARRAVTAASVLLAIGPTLLVAMILGAFRVTRRVTPSLRRAGRFVGD